MSLSFFISKRYIREKRDTKFISLISVISIVGISLGVAAVIIALTVLNGFEKTIARKIVDFNSHILISSFSNQNLPDHEEIRPILLDKLAPYADGISPFASKLSIIKSSNFTEGIVLKGIMKDLDVSDIRDNIVQGSFDISPDSSAPKLILGKKLAEKLKVKADDRVTVFTLKNNEIPSPQNPPGIESFKVEGIFESTLAEYDDQYAYTDLSVAQKLFGMDSNVNGYDIKLNDISKIDSLTENLQDYLGYPYFVRSIFQAHRNIFTWIDLQKKPIPIVLGLIIIVAVINIVGSLLMMALERTVAIGALKAMGAARKQIVRIFIYQGAYLAITGIALGNFLALTLSLLQKEFNIITLPASVYFMSEAPISIEPVNYAIVSVITFILALAAAYAPSLIAAKINTIKALRFE